VPKNIENNIYPTVYTFIVMKAYLDKLSDAELEDLLSNVFAKLLEDFNNIRDVDIETINSHDGLKFDFVKGLKDKVESGL